MVTAHYENGTNNEPGPLEYAAIVFAPGMALMPPTPTGVAATVDGLAAPDDIDLDWIGVIRPGWDRLADDLPLRVGSYALVRTQQAPAGGVEAIMDPRPHDTAVQPIGASTSEALAGSGRLSALDDRYHLASAPNPNQLSYGVAHQDLFGQWSDWASASTALGEPPVGVASLIAASWDVTAAAAVCPGALSVDIAWNWASRSPCRIDLVGRMYTEARLDDPPGDLSVPAGLAPSLAGGSGVPVAIEFDSTGVATVVAGGGLERVDPVLRRAGAYALVRAAGRDRGTTAVSTDDHRLRTGLLGRRRDRNGAVGSRHRGTRTGSGRLVEHQPAHRLGGGPASAGADDRARGRAADEHGGRRRRVPRAPAVAGRARCRRLLRLRLQRDGPPRRVRAGRPVVRRHAQRPADNPPRRVPRQPDAACLHPRERHTGHRNEPRRHVAPRHEGHPPLRGPRAQRRPDRVGLARPERP